MDERNLYTISQIRQLEQLATSQYNYCAFDLMQSAAKAAWQVLSDKWPGAKKITVICGPGNNGADGYVLASIASLAGLEVSVRSVGEKSAHSQAALQANRLCQKTLLTIQPFDPAQDCVADVVVDAILGIGVNKPVKGVYEEAIKTINAYQLPILSMDVPSGLDADTGSIQGEAIFATHTVTFIGLKQGLFTCDGLDYCGQVHLASLNLPAECYQAVTPCAQLLSQQSMKTLLPVRKRNVHKGDFGHVVILGGDYGMAGAVRLAAQAALRVGAGLVSVISRPEQAGIVCAQYPEIMFHGWQSSAKRPGVLNKASVLVIGPGLGQEDWGQDLLKMALEMNLPKVIDADALNLLGVRPLAEKNSVYTPHPGEAARLLGWENTKQVQQNRPAAIEQLAGKGGTWVLKGAGTLIKGNEKVFICKDGNAGMASGGMGDVLSGVIAGMMAQGMTPLDGARAGVLIHALAGDLAAKQGERGLVASDVVNKLASFVNIPNLCT